MDCLRHRAPLVSISCVSHSLVGGGLPLLPLFPFLIQLLYALAQNLGRAWHIEAHAAARSMPLDLVSASREQSPRRIYIQ